MKESMKRRDFLKVMGVGSVYLIAKNLIPGGGVDLLLKVSQLVPTDGSGKRWGMVIDVARAPQLFPNPTLTDLFLVSL